MEKIINDEKLNTIDKFIKNSSGAKLVATRNAKMVHGVSSTIVKKSGANSRKIRTDLNKNK